MSKGKWDTTAWGNGPDGGASGEFTAGEAKRTAPETPDWPSKLQRALHVFAGELFHHQSIPVRIVLACVDLFFTFVTVVVMFSFSCLSTGSAFCLCLQCTHSIILVLNVGGNGIYSLCISQGL